MTLRNVFIALALFCGFANHTDAQEPIYNNAFRTTDDLSDWDGQGMIEDGNLVFTSMERTRSGEGIRREIEPSLLTGKVIRIGCEVKGENILDHNQISPYHGAKVQLLMREPRDGKPDQKYWVDLPVSQGSFDWKKVDRIVAVPRGIGSVEIRIGFQESGGTFMVRNFIIEALGETLDIPSTGNRSLTDDVAGDTKGGWTDQGPGQDGRGFLQQLSSTSYSGVPMYVERDGSGILVMKHQRLPDAPGSVEIPVADVKASTLFIMHAVAWPSASQERVGTIVVTGENGNHQDIPVRLNQDVGEWFYSVVDRPNASPIVTTRMPGGEAAGVYISKFRLRPEIGKIRKVIFQTDGSSMWLILAATVVNRDIPLPGRIPPTIRAGEEWIPLVGNPQAPIAPGTALDLSSFTPEHESGSRGRVIINDRGRFAFETAPEDDIRFFTCTLCPRYDADFSSHEGIDHLLDGVRRSGYNMIRLHFVDRFLMEGATRPAEFNALMLDRFDYLIHSMKKRGLYLNLDLMTSWLGYTPGDIYSKENLNPLRSFKARLHFEPEVRENWRKGVEKLLCRVNPYTGLRLIDDPVLAMAVAYNEQEYGFWRDFDTSHVLPLWREFLKHRYGSIDSLRRAWGAKATEITSFDQVPCFGFTSRLPDSADAALFLREVETGTATWYRNTMQELGYPGPVTAYNCGKTMYYNIIRSEMPVVAMNAYHAHPSNWISPGSAISQRSSIEERFKIMRDLVGTRQAGKPFVVTEHGLVFWNRYRYEQAFTVGAYAALQGLDGLSVYGSPVRYKDNGRILSFENSADPIAKASEFLTYFLFVRRDVSEASQQVRVQLSSADLFEKEGLMGGMPTDLSLLALVARIDVQCMDRYDRRHGEIHDGVLHLRPDKTTAVLVSDAGFSQTIDKPDETSDSTLKILRDTGMIGPGNRSDGRSVFQSATGEILAETPRHFMQIDTPRFQGICAEAGEKASLADVTVESLSENGVLAVVSIDGHKPVKDAERLMVVYASNALNSGMQFGDKEMTILKYVGDHPALLKRGRFSITIRNANAKRLSLYPLDFSGKRLREIQPSKIHGTQASFDVDTLKDGGTVFFEVQARP